MAGNVPSKTRAHVMRMLAGGLFGAVGAGLFLTVAGKSNLDLGDPGTMLPVVAGLSYGLMGLAVGPGASARFLNVEDADEIREQKRSLVPSAIVCILIGAFLLILTASSSLAASIGRDAVALLAIGALAAVVVITVATRGRADELIRRISAEASALALHTALVVLGAWAVLAQLGYVGWMSPLSLIAGLAMLELASIFAVSAARGLMSPR